MVLWFIFTVVRKLFVLALVIALAVGAWMIWQDPALLLGAWRAVSGGFDGYA
ncbi:MAG: hypothetical protein ACK4P4_18255 [Allorhizobium sp.]